MKLSHIAIAASLSALAMGQAYAAEDNSVLRFQSTRSASQVHAEAVAAAHAANPYAEAASSGVAATPAAPRDRAAVQAEARARANAPVQTVRGEA